MDEDFQELVQRLKIAHSNTLVSVILYGSVLAHPQHTYQHDYHILVLTHRLGAEELKAARPVAKWWVESGYVLPVYFTAPEFIASLDVFAIEFRHMKRSYRVLYGEDLFADHDASDTNLRLQTEYELRGKLLRLRSLYLPSSESAETLTKLMVDSIYSFVQFFRPILELLGTAPPLGRLETVQLIGAKLSIDVSSLENVLRLREQETAYSITAANDLFAQYLDCLTQIVEAVNRM